MYSNLIFQRDKCASSDIESFLPSSTLLLIYAITCVDGYPGWEVSKYGHWQFLLLWIAYVR
jgi:hypothetical protein